MGFNRFAVLLICGLLAAESTWAANLYRYRDKQGRVVITSNLPPEVVAHGYDILNGDGQLLETVPRALTAAEIEKLSDAEKHKRAAKEEEERQREADKMLMLNYSDVKDIEAARDRTLKELDISLSVLKGSQLGLRRKVEAEQERAANAERAGRKVPESILQVIRDTQRELAQTEETIALRQREKEEVRQQFQRDIQRFRYITEELGFHR